MGRKEFRSSHLIGHGKLEETFFVLSREISQKIVETSVEINSIVWLHFALGTRRPSRPIAHQLTERIVVVIEHIQTRVIRRFVLVNEGISADAEARPFDKTTTMHLVV